MTDPYRHEIIDLLQPLIDGKVSYLCDLERQERVTHFVSAGGTPKRHSGHTWCHDNPFTCDCPCHMTDDQIALKLIDYLGTYSDPAPIVGTWCGAYMGRQIQEAQRLRSLAHGRDAMVKQVAEALTGVLA